MKLSKIKKALKNYKAKTRVICGLLASLIFICTFTGCSSSKDNTFTVSFDGNGGTLIAGELNQEVTNSSEIVAPSFEMRGYTFDGWSIPLETITETTTVKAEWNIVTYTINYHLDGGTNNLQNPNHYNVLSDNIFLKNAVKNGYTFDYWADSNGNKITTVYPADAKNIDLYAHYKTVGYSITYELNGGTMTSTAPKTYNIESGASIPDAKKDGYTFLGWTTKQTGLDAKTNYIIQKGTYEDVKLYAFYEANEYTITYDVNGGNALSSNLQKVVFDSPYTLKTPYRDGYTFNGWYDGSNKIESGDQWKISKNVNLVASWGLNTYSITYNLNGGTNNALNKTSYTVKDSITFAAPTKTGYTFLGWFDNNGNQVISITAGTTGALTLTAHWNEGDSFTVTLDANGGLVSETMINVQYDHSYSLPSPTRDGYTLDGWYDGSAMINSSGTWKYNSNKSLLAHWKTINYSIIYNLNGGTNDQSNPSSYTIEDNITFAAPTKTGYTFLGWYDNDKAITEISIGNIGELNIEARWTANLNTLSVTSEDTSKGTVAITSGSGYSDESITVVATPVGDCVFKGWYHESKKISYDATYTFIMPTSDYSLVAHFFTKSEEEEEKLRLSITPTISEDGKTITYGLYPQTNVNDTSLISSLDSLTTPESNGWYLYNGDYYAKVSATTVMSFEETFDNGTIIIGGTTYWFKCEPITWIILSNTNGEYYIVSSVLLDIHCYYHSDSNRTIDGKTIYPNNYKYSDIRKWLNEDFYNSAFALGNEYIQPTTVDNSASTTNSTSNRYACDNTEDKVFLPSYQDYINSSYGFSTSYNKTDARRGCKTTDWARARGAGYSNNSYYLYNDMYWTRSPDSSYDCGAWTVWYEGNLSYTSVYWSGPNGVRPSLSILIA